MPSIETKALTRGLLIVLEGIDGSGKTTQVHLLKHFLLQKGFQAVCFKEPTQGRWGRRISEIAQWGRKGISPQEEMEFFLKDREEDVAANILPALKKNKIVIMDRYYYSSIAYQGALGLDPSEIKAINEQRFPKPDLVFILTIPPTEGLKRIMSSREGKKQPGYEEEVYLTRVAKIIHDLNDPNIRFIDGKRPIDIIHQEIASSVLDRLDP
jgi:dTMP kinase